MKRILALMLCAVLIFPAKTVYATSSKLSDAESEMSTLKEQLSEAQDLIDSLEDSKDDIEDKVAELDAQLTEISAQLQQVEADLESKNEEIETTQAELDSMVATADQQYEDMKLRIQFMYESQVGNSYVTLLLTSGSISELLTNLEYVTQISNYDREQLTAYQDTITEISNYEETLEADKAELEELQAVVEEQKSTISSLESAKVAELASVNSEISDAEALAEEYEAEIKAQEEVIAQIKAEIAAEEAKKAAAEASGETYEEKVYSGGVFTWPCPSSTRITSDFGYRESPTAGASTYHKGIDIGASYGAIIVAAADGTVTYAGYSSSAGNYVIINHGSGLRTVYMHCSSLAVSAGQTVTAGQTIAYVGSTGISTGNHLHFGVSLNGEYVSPWSYLS